MINIRAYSTSDAARLWALKFNTIRTVNINHYSQTQVEAWAPATMDLRLWQQRIDRLAPFVAEIDNDVVGFADLQHDGYIDHFFCHHDYQGRGVGRCLMTYIIKMAKTQQLDTLYSHVSITARPFFERFGFVVEKEQDVPLGDRSLTNCVMRKYL